MENKLMILDVMNLAHKCYWVHKSLMNSHGRYTGVIYGARNFMNEVMYSLKPTHFLAITDAEGPTFRHEMYPEYKANRTAKDIEFTQQIPDYYEMFRRMGINIIECQGFEADDVIGSAVKTFQDQAEVTILSGDKDFMQLLGHPNVKLGWTDTPAIGVDGVQAKFGIHPSQMIDYLSIVGDTADNVPGVKGVGPKKASALLSEFQTLDGVYANIPNIKGKALPANLAKAKDNAYLSKSLVAIRTDIQLGLTLDQLAVSPACLSTPEVVELYKHLEFRTGIPGMGGPR